MDKTFSTIDLQSYVPRLLQCDWVKFPSLAPWDIVTQIPEIMKQAIASLNSDFRVNGDVAIHHSATVEPGAVIKSPAIIGPRCYVASSAYLRGGVFMEEDCTVGPSAELKTILMFKGSKLAHLNFAGDSILGEGVNMEAGSMIVNFRNELADKLIRIQTAHGIIETGVREFGALVGDQTRIGANAVIAPGALLRPRTIVGRLSLIDQGVKEAHSLFHNS